MANKEEILVRAADGAPGIFIIDPNAVIKDGKPMPRYIKQEDLMIYVEVKAFMNPKAKYVEYVNPPAGEENPQIIVITKGIFYSSTNALNKDKTQKTKLTTEWTEMFDSTRPFDVEGFGIKNIDIEINASLVPKIHIEFVDVQGKNLMERGDSPDNPYNVFYTFPYPLFELTVKGYFGKAIKIPMIMEKAITKFDPSTGSYLISADFKSWTFAILNDLILLYALITPYMFETPTGFEGKDIIEKKFKELGGSNNKIFIKDLFNFNKKIAKLFQNDLREKTVKRKLATDNILLNIKTFKEQLIYLAANDKTNKSALQDRVTAALNLTTVAVDDIKKMGYTDLDNWAYADIIKLDNFWKPDPNMVMGFTANLTTSVYAVMEMTTDQYNKLTIPIDDFNKTQAQVDVNTARSMLSNLGFDPTVENVVKAVVIHMDAFMQLLRDKTRKIMTDALLDIQGDQKDRMECIELASGKYKRLPWPEFYLEEPKPQSTDPNTASAGGTELVKEYPGVSPDSAVRSWGEVEFIEEMYKALGRFTSDLQMQMQGAQNAAAETFTITPMNIPIDNKWCLSDNNTPVDLFHYLIAKILMMVYHNGLLYRQTDEQERYGEDGVFNYFIKNMLDLLFPPDNFPTNTNITVGALKNKSTELNTIFDVTIKQLVGDSASTVNKLIKERMQTQDNMLVAAHQYYIDTNKLPTDKFKESYLKSKSKVIDNTRYLLSPMGLYFDDHMIEIMDLFSFNTETTILNANVKALMFTNNYITTDMFITRKYD